MRAFKCFKSWPSTALVALFLFLMGRASHGQIIIFPGGGGGNTPTNFLATNTIHFSATNFFAAEDSLFATITVVRDGPITNADLIAVEYAMSDGTAVSGVDYYKQNGTVGFFPGQSQTEFTVQLIDNFSADGNRFLTLQLRNPQSGTELFATLGQPSTAILTILDDESNTTAPAAGAVEIAPGPYRVNYEEWNVDTAPDEANFKPYGPAGAQFTIVRKGGAKGRILVDWQTTTNITPYYSPFSGTDSLGFPVDLGGGLAVPNDQFIPTNGTIVLDDYQMASNVIVRLPALRDPEQWRSFRTLDTNQFYLPQSFGVELTGVRAAPEEAGLGINPTLGAATKQTILVGSASRGFAFTRQHYVVREGQRFVRVRVRRSIAPGDNPIAGVHVHYVINPRLISTDAKGGDNQGNLFSLTPGSEYTSPYIDYEPPGSAPWEQTVIDNNLGPEAQHWVDNSGEATITWGDNEVTDKFILIPLTDDNEAEFNEDIEVILWKHDGESDGFLNGFASRCRITVIDNDQPAGASEVDFNPDSNPLTDPPYMTVPGANNTVQALLTLPDGKVILGGDFSAVNTVPRNKIARLNFDGSTDHSFTPGTGVSGSVRALALQEDGRVLVAGLFDAYNGVSRINLARILTNGVLDTTFNPGLGTDGPIRAVAVQPDGRILIGGDFNTVNGTNINYLARLNADGSLDTSFNTGSGPDGPVNSIAVLGSGLDIDQAASGGPAEEHFSVDTGSTRGSLTITGDLLATPQSIRVYYGGVQGGTLIYDTGLVTSNGMFTVSYPPVGVNPDFTTLEIVVNEGNPLGLPLGAAVWSYHLHVDPVTDARPVIGGEFSSYNGVPINNVARVNTNGSLDRTFDPGSGADDRVYAVTKLGNEVIMAGDFRTVNLQSRRGIARLNEDGAVDESFTPGSGFDNSVFSLTLQPTGKPVVGGPFLSFNQTRRVGIARLNLDGTLDTSFMDQAKNQFAGIPNSLSAENPESQENFVRSIANYRLTNFLILTNFVIDTTNSVTNEVYSLQIIPEDHIFIGGHFSRPGGGFFRDDRRSRLNIARLKGGATPGPGNIGFIQDSYSVDENAGNTFITLVRTNGSLAPVSARFDAKDFANVGSGVAQGGVDYQTETAFPLWIRSHDVDRQYSDAFMGPNFNAFSTNRQRGDFTIYTFPNRPGLRYSNFSEDNVFVSVFDDNQIEGDEVVDLTLSAPDEGRLLLGGQPIPVGTALGKPSATLTIADNDFNFGTLGFSQPEYFVNENELRAKITVTRVGGTSGSITVDVYTQDGSANSSDYTGIPKNAPQTLSFDSGQTTNQFTIGIKNDVNAELEETVSLFLTNATGFPANVPLALRLDPGRSTAVLNIIDDDFAAGRISFAASTYTVSEGDGEVVVTVRRSGGNAGDVAVNFATQNGSARAGIDYVSTNGVLRWTDRDSSAKTFTIPILNNDVVEGEKTINIILSNATIPDALGATPSAVVRIENDDAAGTLSFSQPTYSVDENGPYADITVLRQNGISGTVTVKFAATDATAVGTTNASIRTTSTGIPDFVYPQYSAANGFTNILRFVEGQSSASFRIPLVDDSLFEGEKRVDLALYEATGGAQTGLTNAVLVIVDDEQNRIPAGLLDTEFTAKGANDYVYSLALQSDGRILVGGDFTSFNDVLRNRLARLQPNGVLDPSFVASGPNDSVRSIDLRSFDNRIYVGGLFSSLGPTNRNHLARLNVDGQVDPTFDPGSATDNPIYNVLEQPDGKLLIVGNFSTYRLVSRKGIARVSTNGVLDTTFNPGTGANGAVWAVAVQNDGKVLVGGDFTTFNEVPRNRIVRLNKDGSVDRTFGEGKQGADASVRTIVVQSDGKVLIGGLFTNFNGRPFQRIVRVNSTGSSAGEIDDAFTLGATTDQGRSTNGADRAVNVIALQLDGKILVGGDFTQFNGRTRKGITRLNADGSIDPTINFGLGANGPISTIVVQPDRRILIGGGFTEYDGSPALHVARIHGGSIAGSGQVQFTEAYPSANEGQNAVLTIRRTGGTTGSLKVDFQTLTNETAIPGIDFQLVTNTIEFPEAETFRQVLVPTRRNTNALEDRFIEVVLTNVVGGALGGQPRARVTIINSDAQIMFSKTDYSVTEDYVPGAATITVQRAGSTSQPLSVDFMTQDDTATAGADYGAVNTTITFAPGERSRTVSVPVYDDLIVEGDERVALLLTNVVGTGIIAMPRATLTIVDNDFSAGQIEFTSATYVGLENSRQLVVRLRRIGGTTGVISVEYSTLPGGDNPASTPGDYQSVNGGIISFSDGVAEQSFIIPLVDDQLVEGNETFLVQLANPRGGATISGPTTATAIIVDDDLPSGSLDRSFDPGTGANGEIRALKLDQDGRIMIGGNFTVFNGMNRSHVARLGSDATVDSSFDPGSGPDATVADLDIDADGKFTIGGQFNTVRGLFLNRVARLQADGSPDTSFALPLGLNAEVSEVLRQPDGKVLIGGTFDVVDAAILNHIARLNADGTVDISFNPGGGTDGNVSALALQPDGKILVGGLFSRLDGVFKSGVVRVNANGSVDTSFNPGGAGATGGAVQDILVLPNGQILIVGDFTSYNGTNRARAARLNADGSLDVAFNPGTGPNRTVYTVARQSDGKFIIGGDFTTVGSDGRNRIARLNEDGTDDTEFKPGSGANDTVLAVAIQPEDGRVLIGGRFTEFDNEARPRIARLNNDKSFITPQDVIFAPVTLNEGNLHFTVSTQLGFSYTLESSTNLNGDWKTEQSVVAQGSSTTFDVAPSQTHQFFRIRRD